jgi:uncharacterized protein with FMN-binding domain
LKKIRFFVFSLLLIPGAAAVVILPGACAGFGSGREAPAADGLSAADGVFEGSAPGYRGPIRVRVRMEKGNIAEIEIVGSSEDQFVGGAAMEELLELALMYNTTDLDAVSGATESSEGFRAALENAILGP